MPGSYLKQAENVITITATEICCSTGGELLVGSPQAPIARVSTDTRDDLERCLFVALKGEHFDGGDFAEQALTLGAAGALAERPAAERTAAWIDASGKFGNNGSRPAVIAVEDSGRALKSLASLVAGKSQARIVAITGSSGKTSTKDMLHALLSGQLIATASKDSFNNEVGVPLTLLSLKPDTSVAVVEMGMQRPGEISELVKVAAPDIAVITNIGPAHLEYAGSLEEIAGGKAEIARGLPAGGGLVIPYGEELLTPHISDIAAQVVTFGLSENADVHPVFHRHLEDGRLHCRISCRGEETEVILGFAAHHHLQNFMAALAVYSLLGLPLTEVEATAQEIHLTRMRGERIELNGGVTLLNDCYNANPLSMASALDYLASVALGRRTVAVLGDMSELGADSAAYHLEIGRKAAELGIDCLVGVGKLATGYIEGTKLNGPLGSGFLCVHHADRAAALESIPGLIEPGDVVLVKASRFMKMEEITSALILAGSDSGSGWAQRGDRRGEAANPDISAHQES